LPRQFVVAHLPNLGNWNVQDSWTWRRHSYAWLSTRVLDIFAAIRPMIAANWCLQLKISVSLTLKAWGAYRKERGT
jgi:hypothetical protein